MGFISPSTAAAALCLVAQAFAAPDPLITPRALLPRGDIKTLGWFAESGATATTATFSPWWYDADTSTFTSSGSFLRRCTTSLACTFYTTCSGGWMLASGGSISTWCGISTATVAASRSSYCSYHTILPSIGASSGGMKWYWCDVPPLTGYSIYLKQPVGATPASLTPANSSPTSRSAGSVTSTPHSTPTNTASSSPSPSPINKDNDKSSTPTGAIVGGVVGGLAVLGAIGFGIFFLIRRNKQKKAANYSAAPLMGGGGVSGSTAYQGGGNSGEYFAGSESKPQGTYYAQQGTPQQGAYPMGPYDPHVPPQGAQGGYYPGRVQELGGTGVGAPGTQAHFAQELPAGNYK